MNELEGKHWTSIESLKKDGLAKRADEQESINASIIRMEKACSSGSNLFALSLLFYHENQYISTTPSIISIRKITRFKKEQREMISYTFFLMISHVYSNSDTIQTNRPPKATDEQTTKDILQIARSFRLSIIKRRNWLGSLIPTISYIFVHHDYIHPYQSVMIDNSNINIGKWSISSDTDENSHWIPIKQQISSEFEYRIVIAKDHKLRQLLWISL